jgi:L-asparagine transporter-like permease
MAMTPDMRLAVILGPIWLAVLAVMYFLKVTNLKADNRNIIVNLKDQFDCTSGRTTIFLRYFLIIMAMTPDMRLAVILGPIWLAVLAVMYFLKYRTNLKADNRNIIVNLKDQFDCTSGRTTIFLRYFKKYIIMAMTPDMRLAVILGPIWLAVLAVMYFLKYRKKMHTKLMVK